MAPPSALEYQSPHPPATAARAERIAWAALALSVLEIPWFVITGCSFYFLAPVWLHYRVYDSLLFASLFCLLLSAPAALALLASIRVLATLRPNRFTLFLAIFANILSSALIAFVFYQTIIDPANPHAAGYWL